MAKFRKRPVVIEAEQWRPGVRIEGMVLDDDGNPVIETLEGSMRVSPGDWIITGINSEKYPCKPDIFEKTYEPVTELDVNFVDFDIGPVDIEFVHQIEEALDKTLAPLGFSRIGTDKLPNNFVAKYRQFGVCL